MALKCLLDRHYIIGGKKKMNLNEAIEEMKKGNKMRCEHCKKDVDLQIETEITDVAVKKVIE